MIIILYSTIILFATIFGAIAGLGGGVIIKPLFDMIGVHDASTIGFYSSVAVLTMCIVSIFKQIKKGFQFDLKTIICISIGSLIGGLLGETIFNIIMQYLDNNTVKIIQAVLLGITLILIMIYTLHKNKFKTYHMKSKASIFVVGIFLGSISVFLGIGGGPLNVAILMLLFSLEMKESVIYSITTIFFSQVSKLGQIALTGKLIEYDLTYVPFICICAVLGGFIGTCINQKLNNQKIEKIYLALIVLLIGISCYNVISHF